MLCFVTLWCEGKEAKLTAKLGNIANISLSEQKSGLATCFVTFWCQGKEAKLRGLSDAPLSRGFGNVTWQDVCRYGRFTLAETHHKYKLFASHNAQKYLFCSFSLLSVAE